MKQQLEELEKIGTSLNDVSDAIKSLTNIEQLDENLRKVLKRNRISLAKFKRIITRKYKYPHQLTREENAIILAFTIEKAKNEEMKRAFARAQKEEEENVKTKESK